MAFTDHSTKKTLYFDRVLNEEVYQQPSYFPDEQSEAENRLICCSRRGVSLSFGFSVLMTNCRFPT